MKPYIFSILFLLLTNISVAQTKEVLLKKSFKVEENTILNLDLDNVTIVFEESLDDKIHFDYSMTFIRYPKHKKEKLLDGVKINTSKKNNIITLDIKNSMYANLYNHPLISIISMDSLKVALKNYMKFYKKRVGLYQTKDSLINEIKNSLGSEYETYLFTNKAKYVNEDFIKKQKDIDKKFIIKLPKYVKIEIKALTSNLTFNYDIKKPMIVNTFKGELKFKKLLSKENKFVLYNGFFQTEEILGGDYKFKSVHPIKIGSVSDTNIDIETSTIKIGEIGKNVSIKDFSSKLYLYNFSDNFSKFSLKGDYSELNFYNIKDNNFSMDVSGFNTALNMKGVKTTFGISKEEKMTKILQKKRKENIPFLGNIEVELKHGILNLK